MVCVLGLVMLSSSINASSWFDSVVVRDDNGYVSYYDSLSPRKEAPWAIQEKCSKCFPSNHLERNQIFEIDFGEYDIYVIRYSGIGYEYYYFFAYDPALRKLTDKPFVINGKWCADNECGFEKPLLNGPMIEIHDAYIYLRERVHNGTSYNAVLLYCIECDKEMEFDVKYCVEEYALTCKPEMRMNEYLIIKREITEGLRVNCYLEDGTKKKDFIGSYVISSEGNIVDIRIDNDIFRTWVVTSSGIDPHIFSKQGSSLYAQGK